MTMASLSLSLSLSLFSVLLGGESVQAQPSTTSSGGSYNSSSYYNYYNYYGYGSSGYGSGYNGDSVHSQDNNDGGAEFALYLTPARHGVYCDCRDSCVARTMAVAMEIECGGGSSCAGSSLSNSVANHFAYRDVRCDGKASCYGAAIDAAWEAHCAGEMSCAGSQIEAAGAVKCKSEHACFESSIDTGGDVFCTGTRACVAANVFSLRNVYCDGRSSCAYLSPQTYIDGSLYCNGPRSCYAARGISTSKLYADGYYSAEYAVFHTDDSALQLSEGANDGSAFELYHYYRFSFGFARYFRGFTFVCRGYKACSGMEVLCFSGDRCSLVCVGHGCEQTSLTCLRGAYCDTTCEHCHQNATVYETTAANGFATDVDLQRLMDARRAAYADEHKLAKEGHDNDAPHDGRRGGEREHARKRDDPMQFRNPQKKGEPVAEPYVDVHTVVVWQSVAVGALVTLAVLLCVSLMQSGVKRCCVTDGKGGRSRHRGIGDGGEYGVVHAYNQSSSSSTMGMMNKVDMDVDASVI